MRWFVFALACHLAAAACATEALGPVAPTAVVPVAVAPNPPPPPAEATVEPDLRPLVASANADLGDWFAAAPRLEQTLSADDAAHLALAHSPVRRAAEGDLATAHAMLATARAYARPSVALHGWAAYGDSMMTLESAHGVDPTALRMAPGGLSAALQAMAMLPLYTGGTTTARTAAARQRAAASAADLAALDLDLAAQARLQVYRTGALRALIGVAEAALATHTERLREDTAALNAGTLPPANVLRDEAEQARAQADLANAQRDYRLALVDLQTLLGLHPLSAIDVAPVDATRLTEADEPSAAVADDLTLALAQRPELAAARARLRAAGADVRLAQGSRQPQVSAFGMAEAHADRMNADGRWAGYMIGVVAGLPLFDGGQRRAEVAAGRAAQLQLAARETEAALAIARDVLAAHERLAAARANLPAAETALAAASEDYRLRQVRYRNGLATNAEVLDSLQSQTRAAAARVGALNEVLAAREELRRARGEGGPALAD